jgi:uncharacterized RDD family membrane protein YckC
MSWQPPGGDPPPGPETPTPDAPAAQPPPSVGPAVGWVLPTPQPATPIAEGLVIAGVFPRLVAYSIDAFFLGCLNLIITGLLGVANVGPDDTVAFAVSGVLVGIDFLYFVGFWTSGWQGTLGMRLLQVRVLGAASATTIPANDALLRWIALSGAVGILSLVPGIGSSIALLGFVWVLILLISTNTNPLHQGLHDRWARSVVVQRAPGGSGAAIVGCLGLIAFAIVVGILIYAISADQLQQIMTDIGNSV